ncbi:MAG: FMN-binding negative transcriptional regulator [Sphingomonas sp.]|nr:FMN-binding negative transcriptional regulator [Sphingomonas sp.]
MNSPFDQWTDRDIVDLVAAFPLAWVVTANPKFTATPLPILLETDGAGHPVSLLGHFAKRNPQVEQIGADARTLFLFSGPHNYISPELVTTTRNWGPTWNYATARIVADVQFDEALNDEALEKLVGKMEKGRREPWTRSELGPRYERMKRAIIAFRAPIVGIEARFKLGQDERDEVFADILGGLHGSDLADWMRRFNAGR